MTKGELGDILEGLLKECQRRRELGGYSVDAPILAYYCDVLIKLTLHLLNQEKDIIKLQRRKLK